MRFTPLLGSTLDDPPSIASGRVQVRDMAAGLLIRERKQRQVLAPVKRGDDLRRPTAVWRRSRPRASNATPTSYR